MRNTIFAPHPYLSLLRFEYYFKLKTSYKSTILNSNTFYNFTESELEWLEYIILNS